MLVSSLSTFTGYVCGWTLALLRAAAMDAQNAGSGYSIGSQPLFGLASQAPLGSLSWLIPPPSRRDHFSVWWHRYPITHQWMPRDPAHFFVCAGSDLFETLMFVLLASMLGWVGLLVSRSLFLWWSVRASGASSIRLPSDEWRSIARAALPTRRSLALAAVTLGLALALFADASAFVWGHFSSEAAWKAGNPPAARAAYMSPIVGVACTIDAIGLACFASTLPLACWAWRVGRLIRRRAADLGLGCAHCGYPRASPAGETCPECGLRFHAPPVPWQVDRAAQIVMILTFLAVVALFLTAPLVSS